MNISYLVKFRFFCPKCGALNGKSRTLVCHDYEPNANKEGGFVKLACVSCGYKVADVALDKAETGAIALDETMELTR